MAIYLVYSSWRFLGENYQLDFHCDRHRVIFRDWYNSLRFPAPETTYTYGGQPVAGLGVALRGEAIRIKTQPPTPGSVDRARRSARVRLPNTRCREYLPAPHRSLFLQAPVIMKEWPGGLKISRHLSQSFLTRNILIRTHPQTTLFMVS